MFGNSLLNTTAAKAVNEILALRSTEGATLQNDSVSTALTAGIESLTPVQMESATAHISEVAGRLGDSHLKELLVEQFGQDEAAITAGIESAAITMAAFADPAAYSRAFAKPGAASAASKVLGSDFVAESLTAGLESFNSDRFSDFAAASIVMNALNAKSDDFTEALFGTKILSANQGGIDVTVSVPHTLNRMARSTTGAEYNLERKSLVHAVRNAEVLMNNSTKVVPYAKAGNDPFLVAAADVPTKNVMVGGVEVPTRPIKFNTATDLLALSAAPGVVNGTQDETDTLDPAVSLGEVFVKVTYDPGAGAVSQVFSFNTTGDSGSLLTRPAEGRGTALTANYAGVLTLRKGQLDVAASPAEVDATVPAAASLDALSDWAINMRVKISATADDQSGSFEAYANGIEIVSVHGGDNGLEEQPLGSIKTDVTVELVGITPKAARSNMNMRSKGILVDLNNSQNYRLPVGFQAPLSAVTPTVENSGATVEALAETQRVRNAIDAVTALQEIEASLANKAGLTNVSVAAAASLVTPTYRKEGLDLSTMVVGNKSSGFYKDLQETVVNAITTMANRLVIESGYEAALSVMSGSKDYEVVVSTDRHIRSLIMVAGDPRTLGDNVNFRINASDDSRMEGKIYVTLKRKGVDAADPLNFGVCGQVPALIFKADTNVNEIQLQPRQQHHVLCPVLGCIDVAGLDSMLLTNTPRVS